MIPFGVLASARVAAAGGFLPTDISGLVAWYKADAITGVADGAAAATWPDSSGNAHHMSMGRKYLAAGANGLPCVEVNANGRFSAPGTFNMNASNQSIIAVAYLAGGAQNQSIASPAGTSALDLGFNSSGQPYFGFYEAQPAGAKSTAVLAQTTWGIVGGSYSDAGNLLAVRLGGSETTASTPLSPANARGLGFAGWPNGGAKLVGRIAEIIYYHATLTAQQFADVEGYLAAKYGL